MNFYIKIEFYNYFLKLYVLDCCSTQLQHFVDINLLVLVKKEKKKDIVYHLALLHETSSTL
jgi:hypothetical protein